MPRIEGTFPPPIHGVSTVKPRNRGIGYCQSQENFRSDPVDKLTRRPSTEWRGKLRDMTTPFAIHSYTRGLDSFKVIVVPEGDPGTPNVEVYKNGTRLETELHTLFPVSAEDVEQLKFMTIKDKTYILNTQTKPDFTQITYEAPPGNFYTGYEVEDEPDAGAIIQKVSHANVTVAAEYGEKFSLTVTSSLGSISVVYDAPIYIPSGNDTLEGRGTTHIALELANKVIVAGAPLGIFAVSKGSSLAIWEAAPDGDGTIPAGYSKYPWVKAEVETGQGSESLVVINERIEKVDGLPLYAVPGTRIAVRPNPRSDDGTYYLEASPIEGDWAAGTHTHVMEEVVWVEHRSPHEPFKLESSLMPFYVEVLEDSTVHIDKVDWKERRTGDDESCPPPTFLEDNSRITAMSYFQKRLVLLSDDEVHMTETDDLENWWKGSAINTLVTDPIGIASSAPNIDELEQAVQHNKDLLVLARNGQFKIVGSTAVTPQTVSMQLTTAYECETAPQPVGIGNSMYLPMTFGGSAGLHDYSGEVNTSQDTAFNIASHCKGYIDGKIQLLTSSSNLEMLVLTTDRGNGNVLYVFDQMTTRDGKHKQQSWSRWTIPEGHVIVDISMTNDILELATMIGEELHFLVMRMNEGNEPEIVSTSVQGNGLQEIFLDDHIVRQSLNGVSITVPDNYPWDDDVICVRGEGTNYPRTQIPFVKNGNTIVFTEEVGIGSIELGKTFTSSYEPTRPFKRDGDNQTVTTDRVRVSRYRLSVIESYEMWMHIISDYYNSEDQAFNSRIMNANNNLIGDEPFTTDEVVFGFSQDAKYASPEFYTDGFLALTIDGITWEGQYYQSSRRM